MSIPPILLSLPADLPPGVYGADHALGVGMAATVLCVVWALAVIVGVAMTGSDRRPKRKES